MSLIPKNGTQHFWESTLPFSPGGRLVALCMEQHGWSRELALKVFKAYGQLILLKTRLEDWKGCAIMAPPLVDQMWKTHILTDLIGYQYFCCQQVGGPQLIGRAEGLEGGDAVIQQTKNYLQVLFASEVDETIWKFPSAHEEPRIESKKSVPNMLPDPVDDPANLLNSFERPNSPAKMMTDKEKDSYLMSVHIPKRTKEESNSSRKKPTRWPAYVLSPQLSNLLGGRTVLPRSQVVSHLWAYIRAHNLQNPSNRQEILCDRKFRTIMGGRTIVTIFTMHRYLSEHFLEKVDYAVYEADNKRFVGQSDGTR